MWHVMGVVDGVFDQDRQLALATGEYAQLRSRMRPRAPTSAHTYARAQAHILTRARPSGMGIGGLCSPQATMKDKNKRFGEVGPPGLCRAGWDCRCGAGERASGSLLPPRVLRSWDTAPRGMPCRMGMSNRRVFSVCVRACFCARVCVRVCVCVCVCVSVSECVCACVCVSRRE